MGRNDRCTDNNILNIHHGLTIHAMSKTRFYRVWINLKVRCLDSNCKAYPNYGGRGIKVCERWMDFNNFREDMHQSYEQHFEKHGSRDTTIDRIDVNGNYEPSNCRWATKKEQGNNRRKLERKGLRKYSSTFKKPSIEYNGEKHYLKDLAISHGLPPGVVANRIRSYGWTLEKALNTPNGKRGVSSNDRRLEYNGKIYTTRELEKELSLRTGIIRERLNYGWSLEEAINPEKFNGKKIRS